MEQVDERTLATHTRTHHVSSFCPLNMQKMNKPFSDDDHNNPKSYLIS